MEAFQLYKCKHLCMLVFRVLSLSLAKNVYKQYCNSTADDNKSDIMISVM